MRPSDSELPLIAVVGPTGSGKSELALTLAERFNGEIVNCDSVQLYRYMDIGTAKTPVAERRGIPHHLIDILNPDEHFTAGDYARAARAVLHEVAARGRVPVVAGGTGFYLRALLHGLFQGPARDVALRERLAKRTPGSLHRLLSRFDPTAATRIHPNDTKKLIRAVEVCVVARQPMTELFSTHASPPLSGFRVQTLGLDPGREELANRINARCLAMFERGLADEVRSILDRGFSARSKALQSIGYREACLCLEGKLSLAEAIKSAQTATRQYAKRQRTWFRREQGIKWLAGFGDEEKVLESSIHHLQVDIKFS
jgi:tRNA dimethylallyltransferase